ncbi:alpha/beta hydrolase [candidate division KSB1 bacterium]|nr:alpha/beta hydrolase [candidate division KSB1 bacterium]
MDPKMLLCVICMAVCLFFACDLDGFLFNSRELDQYQLPGNTIPDSLLTPVTFKSETYTLYGYWVQSNGQRAGITLLYCHGNKHHLDHYWDRVMWLHRLGINVFVFDYRGFGRSEGETSEAGLYKDGEAALKYVLSRKETNPDSLCFYGYSLGNVVSIYLAAEKFDPLCLFAESPFASANSLTQGSIGLDIPAGWLTEGEFNNAERIKKIKTPFLLLHGTDDDLVRYRDNGRIVFENAPEPKEQIVISGATHTDIPGIMAVDDYLEHICDWIDYSISISE